MDNELISIIVPVYNVEKYLSRCLNSLLSQTYRNIEIIIVDDCSTDFSFSICQKYTKQDNRIKLIKNERNKGIASTRNVGLANCTGKFLFFIDSDDFISENAIETLYFSCKVGNYDIVSCNFAYYYSIENIKPIYICKKNIGETVFIPEEALKKVFDLSTNYRCIWAKLIRKEIIDDLKFEEGNRYGEDMIFTPKMLCRAKTIKHINIPLYFYNQEGVSLTRSRFNANKLREIEITECWIKLTKEKYPSLKRCAEAYHYLTLINLCMEAKREMLHDTMLNIRSLIKSKIIPLLINVHLAFKPKFKALYIFFFYSK